MATVTRLPGQVSVDVTEEGETILQIEESEFDALAESIEQLGYPDERMAALVALLDDMILNQEERFRKVEVEYKAAGESLRRMRQMRRIAVPDPTRLSEPKQIRKPKKQSGPRIGNVSEENIERVLAWFREQDGPVTAPDVVYDMNVGNDTARSAIYTLRDRGMIRAVTKQRRRGVKTGQKALAYVVTENGRA